MATKMPGPDTDIPWVQEEKKGTGEAHIHSYNYVVFCVRTNSICFGHIKMFLVRLGWVFGLFFCGAGLILLWAWGFYWDWSPKRSNSN